MTEIEHFKDDWEERVEELPVSDRKTLLETFDMEKSHHRSAAGDVLSKDCNIGEFKYLFPVWTDIRMHYGELDE